MASPSMHEVVQAVLAADRGLVVASAGCGKTELIARTVAHPKAGRQLILTHTHAGVAALKKRIDKLAVPHDRYHLDTIAAWSMKYAGAYPGISGLDGTEGAFPQWHAVYPAARNVVGTRLGVRVVSASYDGVLVDEYQDCSESQHALVVALAAAVPVRVVGDPLQAIFGFRDDPLADWREVVRFFPALPRLTTPHRWKDTNAVLGKWLGDARQELVATGHLTLPRATVGWEPWSKDAEIEACRDCRHKQGVAAIKRWPRSRTRDRTSCLTVATRLGGVFHMVEAFDDRELPEMATRWATASGGEIVTDLHAFMKSRMVKVGPELNDLVAAVAEGRPTTRFRTHLSHRDRLEAIARRPTPSAVLAALDGFHSERGWTVYRPEGYFQLRAALQECEGLGLEHLFDAVGSVRTRARHRGRHVPRRVLGTTLLLKGLEFDDALVLDADEFSRNELYVAITRGARSLRVLSASRRITPSR